MLPFILYLLTGCLTGFQVLSLVAFVAWGRPVARLELAALLGSASLIALAFYSLFRPRYAVRGALVASIWMFSYYGYAIYAAIKSVVQFGSEYPLPSFIPPVLLVLTFTYSVFATKKADTAVMPASPRRRWISLLLAVFILGASPFSNGVGHPPIDFFVPRKVVTIPMSWKLVHFPPHQPGFIGLETACANNGDSRCVCGVDFRVTTSTEFVNYIQSFEKQKIPVRYENFYDLHGEVVSANLLSVGSWPRGRFDENEQGIGAGERNAGPDSEAITLRNPQDCFAPLRRRQ